MRALMISPEAPYPAIGGGALRTASLLEFLARRYELDVIVFAQPENASPATHFPKGLVKHVHTIPLIHHGRDVVSKVLRNAMRLLRGVPPLVDRFQGYEDQIVKAMGAAQYEMAVFEHLWCAPLLRVVKPHAKRTCLNLHNIESNLFESYARTDRWPVSMAHRRWASSCRSIEQNLLPQFDSLLTCSETDSASIAGFTKQTFAFPNSIPRVPLPQTAKSFDLVFSGNMEYPPNKAAVGWFAKEIWPLIIAARPDTTWRVVGLHPDSIRSMVAGDPRVEVTGPVENAVETLASARIAIVPLRSGSGTRIKILEAWAAGLAVVSTNLGAEGLACAAGKEIILQDTAVNFSQSILKLLNDPTAMAQLGSAGRCLYERDYTWQAAWEKLELAKLFAAGD